MKKIVVLQKLLADPKTSKISQYSCSFQLAKTRAQTNLHCCLLRCQYNSCLSVSIGRLLVKPLHSNKEKNRSLGGIEGLSTWRSSAGYLGGALALR